MLFRSLEYPYYALSAEYAHDDNISLSASIQQYADGHVLSHDALFNSVNDLSINRYTGMFVADKANIASKIVDTPIVVEESFSNSKLFLYNKGFLKFVVGTLTSRFMRPPPPGRGWIISLLFKMRTVLATFYWMTNIMWRLVIPIPII